MSNHLTRYFQILSSFVLLFAIAFVAPAVNAQTLDTGSLRGQVRDTSGRPLPGAVVRAKGPQGVKATEADNNGNYSIPFMVPGVYSLTVSIDGFSTQTVNEIAVSAQQVSVQSFKLAEGSEVVVIRAGASVDTHSSTTITKINLSDAMKNFAQGTSLTSAFDFAPGVNANSGVGGGNVSIAGASGLENQYMIGGINITGSGYGSIGAYDQGGGARGSGITTAFLENLDIREGGFEAEYGGALGGVISATAKSGSNDFHGNATFYYTPRALDGDRRDYQRPGGYLNVRGENSSDLQLDLGGPIIKDKLFFYVGLNPTWTRDYYRFDMAAADSVKDGLSVPNANREYDLGNQRTDNFMLHVGWNISAKHMLDFLYFQSPQSSSGLIRSIGRRVAPSDDPGVPVQPTVNGVINTPSLDGAGGRINIEDFSGAIKYFGTLTPTMNVEAQVSMHRSRIKERPTAGSNTFRYEDIRRLQVFNAQTRNIGAPGIPNTPFVSPATYTFGGVGFYQGGSNDETRDYSIKLTHDVNWAGAHEIKWGASLTDLRFHENNIYSGPQPEISLDGSTTPDRIVRLRTGAQAQVRCSTIDPSQPTFALACGTLRYRISRGNFNPAPTDTTNRETNFFIQDRWSINARLTLSIGVRWVQEKLSNNDSFSIYSARTGNIATHTDSATGLDIPYTFAAKSYGFRGEYSPRLGLSWDVLANGKSRLYANYARLYERVPNDLAVRSFGNEFSLLRAVYLNPDLSGLNVGVPLTVGSTPTRVETGTRLPYKDDFTMGYEFEVAPQFKIDIKGQYRKQGRVLEDTQAATMDAIQNYYYSPLINSYCMNCSPGQTELFPGAGNAFFGQYVLANVGSNAPKAFPEVYPSGTGPCPQYPTAPDCSGLQTGVLTPVSFGTPKSRYRALSVTLSKVPAEGEHLSIFATYRLSRVDGNYEGLFRNDNGQSDPNITSLFDFPNSHLARSQYFDGILNTDTPNSLRIRMGYRDLFIKNLSGSLTFKWQSGALRTPLVAHPVYQNGGEIPGDAPQYYQFDFNSDGYSDFSILKDYRDAERGANGREADDATWDAGLNYAWNLGRSNLRFSLLVTNLFNDTHVLHYDDFVESQTGVINPYYNTPAVGTAGDPSLKPPRSIRLGVGWSF